MISILSNNSAFHKLSIRPRDEVNYRPIVSSIKSKIKMTKCIFSIATYSLCEEFASEAAPAARHAVDIIRKSATDRKK